MSSCFDISDLVSHIAAHRAVSGIQRVQLQLLSACLPDPRAVNMRCLMQIGPSDTVTRSPLRNLLSGDHRRDLKRLIAVEESAHRTDHWPDRATVKLHLNRHGYKGLRRAFGKIGFYGQELLRLGIRSTALNRDDVTCRDPAKPQDLLPSEEKLVILGNFWSHGSMVQRAVRHSINGGRVAVFVHDLLPLSHPYLFADELPRMFAQRLAAIAPAVSAFICTSRSTHEALVQFLARNNLSTRACLVPLAHEFAGFGRNTSTACPKGTSALQALVSSRPFVLCVGTIEPRKNGERLLDVWLRLRSRLGNDVPNLVFCGRKGWKSEGFFTKLSGNAWLSSRTHVITTATDGELAYLYQRCLFTVYPSLFEGWGLPIGEAAWFGRACVTSNRSSMPEVLGRDRAVYVNPEDTDELSGCIFRMTTDWRLRTQIEDLIRRSDLRTWTDVAREFLDELQDENRS